MLNGALTPTPTEMAAVLVFCTVKVRSRMLPIRRLPKLVVAEGVTVKSGWATPLVTPEHGLSRPPVSTAVTRRRYVAPALRLVTRLATVCPGAGDVVGDGTVRKDGPGQAGE